MVNEFLDGLHLYLELESATLIGVGRKGGLSSHIVPCVPITVGYLPYLGFLFLQGCVSNILDFCRNIEESAPFLRVPRSILVFKFFWRRLRSCRLISSHCKFLRNLLRIFLPPDILVFLFSCLRVADI